MSETQSTLFNKRAGGLWIAGAFLLLAIVVVVSFRSKATPEVVKERTGVSELHRVCLIRPKVFDAEAFKRTIIDNNLFRPLGWTPPRPTEPYRLIGTILPRSANAPPKAIIQTTAGNKTYIVSIGEALDASTEVVDIQPKQVTLSTNGQQRTLRLNTAVPLNASAARRSPRPTTHTPHRPTPRRVRSNPTPAPPGVSAPQSPNRYPSTLSEWETREGQPIPIGDARLKNPQKWQLRRR